VRELANRCLCLEKVTCRIFGICFKISRETNAVVRIYTDQICDANSGEDSTEPVCVSSDDEPKSLSDDAAAPCRRDCEDCEKKRLYMSFEDKEEDNPEYPDDATTDENSVWSSIEEEFE
jgi:hypothetical protein